LRKAAVGAGRKNAAAAAPVSGVVTFKGQPLEGAMVTFVGENSGEASGKTDELGRFELSANGKKRVPEGSYRVTIKGEKVAGRYADPDQTTLLFKVMKGENVVNFDLK
jgi:hypothetical protein